MKTKEVITKLQSLPDKQKKVILWTIVVILGLIMGFFWINSAAVRFSNIGKDFGEMRFSDIETLNFQ